MGQPKRGSFCPLVKGDCKELECLWYTQVRGTNPSTGAEVDDYACAVSWLPVLLIENTGQQRGTGAAVEGLRNELNKSQVVLNTLGLLPGDSHLLLKHSEDKT